MTKFANVQLHAGLIVDPFLSELVDKLALRNPNFTIGTKGMSDQQRAYCSSTRPRGGKGSHTPLADDQQYIYKLNVHCGSELLGSVSVDIRYGRSSGSELVYCIASWRINNERGSMNAAKTAKLDTALRTAKRVFVPQNTAELLSKTVSTVSTSLMHAVNDLRRPIVHNSLVSSNLVLQQYLYYHVNGKEIPTQLKQEVEKSFTTPKYHTAMAEFELAAHMTDQPMKFIRAHNGGYLYWQGAEEDNVIMFRMFEELPEETQNHISVLQLMQDNELVLNVGYRHDSENFAVMDFT